MTWVFLAVLGGTVLSALAYRQDLFSPARSYLTIYSLLLAINSLKLSRVQVPWCLTTHIFFWGASAMFISGAMLMAITDKSKNPTWKLDFKAVKRALALDALRIDWKWFRKVWIFCVAVFLTSYFVAFLKMGEIPIFSAKPEEARLAFSEVTIPTYYGLYFGPISMMLAIEMILFGGYVGRKLKAVYAVLGLVTLLYLTVITRFDIFRFLLFFVVLFHYGKKNLKLSHLVIVLVAVLAVFISASLIRINQDAMGALSETIKTKIPRNWLWATGFYAYLANDFWNMNYAFQKFAEGDFYHPLSLGLGMMRAVTVNLLRIEGALISTFGYENVMNGGITRVQGLNTVVYVWHLWKDFGAVGVFLMPLVGGMLLAKFHINSLRKPTLFRMSMWGCLIAIVVLSFHIPVWELWFFHVNLLVIAVAHRRLLFFGNRKVAPVIPQIPAAPSSGPGLQAP